MSEVKVNKISPSSGTAFTMGDSGDTFTVPSGATIVNSGTATGFGGGKIGQVLQTVNTDTETVSTTTPTLLPDFTLAITPVATSSKILIISNTPISSVATYSVFIQLFRDTTQIFMGDAAGDRPRASMAAVITYGRQIWTHSICYLDSPSSTSEIDYTIKWFGQVAGTFYMNRTQDDQDLAQYPRVAASITAMEVLA